ncbi:hypothetical protein GN956_G17108 [Arapaima gigas]
MDAIPAGHNSALADGKLQVEQRDTLQNQQDQEGDHERTWKHRISRSPAPTSPMALAQVREPPDVTQTHTEAHAGQEVLGLVLPLGSVCSPLHLQLLQLLIG